MMKTANWQGALAIIKTSEHEAGSFFSKVFLRCAPLFFIDLKISILMIEILNSVLAKKLFKTPLLLSTTKVAEGLNDEEFWDRSYEMRYGFMG